MRDACSALAIAAIALAGTGLLGAQAAAAAEVYRWVDTDGRVHFSDTRPEAEDLAVTTLEFTELTTGYDPSADPYSILNQAARTHARWQTLEAARQAQAQARADAGRPAANAGGGGYDRERRALLYLPLPRRDQPQDRAQTARRQSAALDALGLAGARSYSINSGEHRERVQHSRSLPLALDEAGGP